MRQSSRLIINTVSSFGRMVVTVALSLAALRLLIQALGDSDYGLLTALGATGLLLQMFTEALTGTVQRHLSYELGRRDEAGLGEVFNTALVLFVSAALVLWLVGQAIQPAVLSGLTIPDGRLGAAWWVYQVTLLSIASTLLLAPYLSLLQSHQSFVLLAVFDTVTACTRFLAVVALWFVPGDPLIVFVLLQFAGMILARVGLMAWCLTRHPVSRPSPARFALGQVRRIGGFAGWVLLGGIGWRLKMQGGVVLLNIVFGPVVNAAYAVSIVVATYVTNFSWALSKVVQPVMVASEAAGDRNRLHDLTVVHSKYTVIGLSMLFLPIWIEADAVLTAWLGSPPAGTVLFVRLVLVWSLIDQLTMGYALAVQAQGSLARITLWSLLLNAGALLLAWVGFRFLDAQPWLLPGLSVVVSCVYGVCRVVLVGRLIGLRPAAWVRRGLGPTLACVVPGGMVSAAAAWALEPGVGRVAVVFGGYGVVTSALAWCLALEPWERRTFERFAQQAAGRVGGLFGARM